MITRRQFLENAALVMATPSLLRAAEDPIAPYRTPYKYPELVLKGTGNKQDFDSKSVDDPFVFFHEGAFHMLYIGFDGTGYQTGMAKSTDLVNWVRDSGALHVAIPIQKYTRYNVALGAIVRENGLYVAGKELKQDVGRYLCAWNAYPNAGLEQGAAVIGLAWSDNLSEWELTEPILFPADGDALGAWWSLPGPNLIEEDGVFYLFYNAKTDPLPKSEGGGWHEQTGVATSRDLEHWTRSRLSPILRNGPRGSATYPATDPRHDQSASDADARDSRFASNPYVVQVWDAICNVLLRPRLISVPAARARCSPSATIRYDFTKVPEVLIDTGAPGSIDETYRT